MSTRKAEARWDGTLKEGSGILKTESGACEGKYTFRSRFEEGEESNPEELIGAALASCYSMFLSSVLEKGGHPSNWISTTASVDLGKVEGAPRITRIHLDTHGQVPGIDDTTFLKYAEEAKVGCPVSNAISSTVQKTLNATLAP